MHEQVITQKAVVSGWRILFAWCLLILLPIMMAIPALSFFLREFAVYIEPERLSEAMNDLESYKSSQVVENFITSQLPVLSSVLIAKSESPEQIKGKIDAIIGGKTLFCLFFDKNRQHLFSSTFCPDDLRGVALPGAAFFKRQIQLLSRGADKFSDDKAARKALDTEKKRIALSMQQAFKSLTPVTLQASRVVKNYSLRLGGDLYFIYAEFNNSMSETAGFMAVLRGREFSEQLMLKQLQQTFPFCRTVLRKMEISRIIKRPELLYSGIKRFSDRLLITMPADQRFIRHLIHRGGIFLKADENHLVPFVQYHLPLSSMNHQFAYMQKWAKLLASLLLLFSGVYCLNVILFGFDSEVRFKTRILATTLVAAMFPFSFFSAGLYLHHQYEQFVQRISLIQHVNIRLEILNAELEQYLAWIEGELTFCLQQINPGNFQDDQAIRAVFAQAGKSVPFTRLSLQRIENRVQMDFPERSSGQKVDDATNAIEQFFPLKSLQLLRENEPLARIRQDMLKIPGQWLKIEALGKNLTSNGSLFTLDRAMFPVWLAGMKIVDSSSSQRKIMGLLVARFEPAFLIKTFLEQSSFARTGYQENFSGYRIKYAVFPTDRSGAGHIWVGSGHVNDAALFSAGGKAKSEMVVSRRSGVSEEFIINRLNHGMPHNAVAHAFPLNGNALISFPIAIVTGSLLYLLLLLLLVGRLIDLFFVQPVITMAINVEQIAEGYDEWPVFLQSGDELSALDNSFADLVKGLQQRNMLRDYVSVDAFEDLSLSAGLNLVPGGEYLEATIVFVALKDYQMLTRDLAASQSLEVLNLFIRFGDLLAREAGGSIDKILNHTLMLVFRELPGEEESHALRAARTVIQLREVVHQHFQSGILAGIASGTVVSGKIGSNTGKLDFTVIGNPVNLAARLKAEAGAGGGGVIIAGSSIRLLKGKGRITFLRRCPVKGKARQFNIYELVALRNK